MYENSLTLDELNKAISLIDTPAYKDIPIKFELNANEERKMRDALHTPLYSPPSPNTILAHYNGIPVFVDESLPDGIIKIVYKDKVVAKLINWK